MSKIQSIRGFNDIITDIEIWQIIERTLSELAAQYGYSEIRTPLLEESRLFERSIGVTSDIVHKEMYTFTDKNETSVSLRPEGTASVVRACIEKNLLYDQARKWFYIGSMYRRERPQKGRLRQFHQFGMECLGCEEPYADIEQLIIINQIWKSFDIEEQVNLELNYLGAQATRQAYGDALKKYYQPFLGEMSDLNQRRWRDNTLRLLDSKDQHLVEINKEAPTISEFYSKSETEVFDKIQQVCQNHNIRFTINPRLMRGLDYYTGLIYEWKSDQLGAQSTICGGGRYDLLFENLGERRQDACGYSIGLERLIEVCRGKLKQNQKSVIHLACDTAVSKDKLLEFAEDLRNQYPNICLYTQLQPGKSSALVKRSLKKNASKLIIMDENYHKTGQVTIKDLVNQSQASASIEELKIHLGTLT